MCELFAASDNQAVDAGPFFASLVPWLGKKGDKTGPNGSGSIETSYESLPYQYHDMVVNTQIIISG